ncbi:ATP-binding protein [Crocosphaera sp. XPORK-15E]|uniref:ATP-binding protein n=1 Tax=Crocosphaera sp. XPORK-15E TaxID=3110247 RepID=UPI002B216439|nr:ATP-binding protein [Crocosphaera sp. XPORK-15E]MEA5537186.1 ATP-binding protein [Crocosphaera sp. XPORK-15E]
MFERENHKNQSLIEQFRLSVRTEIEALEEVLLWFEAIAKPYLLKKSLWECKLALAEGFTNTVYYAHQDLQPLVPIILEIHFYLDWIEMQIWNVGPPFDLQGKLTELRKKKGNPLDKESDRGLFFMQELTDELDYIRVENKRNCLIMRKLINIK